MKAELEGLKGGEKRLWLKLNRAEVLNYYQEHGIKPTLVEFGMKKDTFERFLGRSEPEVERMKALDRAVYLAKASMEMSREASRQANILERKVEAMKPVIQIVYTLGQAMRMAAQLSEGSTTDLLKIEESRHQLS